MLLRCQRFIYEDSQCHSESRSHSGSNMEPVRKASDGKIKVATSYLPSDPNLPPRLRDVQLEYKTANWIANLLQEPPKVDFDEWIQDGKILCRVFNQLVFNSVPIDIVDVPTNDIKVFSETRVKELIEAIKEFGVPDEEMFHTKDLTELRNIPRVCRCLAKLRKMADFNAEDDGKDDD